MVLKEDKDNAINGKAKGQCSRGDVCRFRHDEDKRAKPTPKTAPPSEPPTLRGRSASRKKNLRSWTPSGKFPNVTSRNLILDAFSVTSARLHTGRLKVNPAKNRKRMVTKVQWLC